MARRPRGLYPARMTDRMRSIAVHVGEPQAGAFYWVLMEKESAHCSTVFHELAAARRAASTWIAALEAGVDELKRLAGDLARGPRAEADGPEG